MAAKIFLRSGFPFNYDTFAASDESAVRCEDPSLAKQSFAEEADINTIVRRFHLSGQLPVGARAPTYRDFEGVFDYQSAMNALVAARESFMALPASVRSRFHNDPAEFVDFCSDEGNRAEAEKLGLIVPAEPAPEAPAAPVGGAKGAAAPVSGGDGGKPTP